MIKINIEIDGENHEFTINEARHLYDELDKLFKHNNVANPLRINDIPLEPYPPYVKPMPFPWDTPMYRERDRTVFPYDSPYICEAEVNNSTWNDDWNHIDD